MPPTPQGTERTNLFDASEALGTSSRTFEQRHWEVKSLACVAKPKWLSWDVNPCSHHYRKQGCNRSGKVMKTRNQELMRAEGAEHMALRDMGLSATLLNAGWGGLKVGTW